MNITEEAKKAALDEGADDTWENSDKRICPVGHYVQKAIDSALSDAQKTIEQLREEVSKLKEALELWKKSAGGWSRVKDYVIAGNGPEEYFRWLEALKEHAKDEGAPAVDVVLSYITKLWNSRDQLRTQTEQLQRELQAAREDVAGKTAALMAVTRAFQELETNYRDSWRTTGAGFYLSPLPEIVASALTAARATETKG